MPGRRAAATRVSRRWPCARRTSGSCRRRTVRRSARIRRSLRRRRSWVQPYRTPPAPIAEPRNRPVRRTHQPSLVVTTGERGSQAQAGTRVSTVHPLPSTRRVARHVTECPPLGRGRFADGGDVQTIRLQLAGRDCAIHTHTQAAALIAPWVRAHGERCVFVTDANVRRRVWPHLIAALRVRKRVLPEPIVVPPGEASKSVRVWHWLHR